MEVTRVSFNEEASKAGINRVSGIEKDKRVVVVIGRSRGKIIDAAKSN